MTTVTAKELRVKFPEISKRLFLGESFVLIYNSKPLCEMVPFAEKKKKHTLNSAILKKLMFRGGGKSAVQLIRDERSR